MRYLRALLFFGFLSFSWFPCSKAQSLVFRHLAMQEGLSQSPIFSIYQDARGFIWIGSRDGLIRYDGYEFKNYYNDDYYANSNNHRDIYSITESKNGNLWIGTPSGLTKFNRTTETFSYIAGAGKGTVYKLLRTPDWHLWMATQSGLLRSDRILTNDKPDFRMIWPQRTNTVFIDQQHNVWLGLNSGVVLLNKRGKKQSLPQILSDQTVLPRVKVSVIVQDREGDIWFGTESAGVFNYNPRKQTCTNFRHEPINNTSLLEDFIKDIYVNDDGRIWISTRNGLSIFDKDKHSFTNYQHHSEDDNSLSNNSIWNIMKDRAGSIWLTTYAGGINVYDPSNNNFSNIGEQVGQKPGLSHPVVTAMLDDNNTGLWIGTDGGGLNHLDYRTGRFRYYNFIDRFHGKANNIIFALAHHNNGGIWVATLDGLARLTPGSEKFDYLTLDTTRSKLRVDALAPDDDGIWIGTDIAGLKFLSRKGRLYNYTRAAKQVSSNHINALFKDKNGNIWIGTSEGLNFYDKLNHRFSSYRNNNSKRLFNSNDVLSLFQDSHGALWIGTRAGVFLFDTGEHRFISLNNKGDLQDKSVKSVIEDDNGHLWLGTNRGVVEIIPERAAGQLNLTAYRMHTYMAVDGLASNQFSANAALKVADRQILFGGVNGITRFDPDKIVKNNFKPRVMITGLEIYGKEVGFGKPGSPLKKPIEETTALTLNHDQAYITFRFSALNYINSVNNQYAYKLEGLANDNWHYGGSQRLATYTNLEAGTYTFKVKAANNDGVWNDEETTIRITVLSPWWATWWAWLSYALATVTGLYFIIRFFKIKARLEHDLQLEHVEKMKQEELHQAKLSFFTHISHEIRTPLTLISAPIEKLIVDYSANAELSGQLTHIHRNAGRLLQLINELMDFRKAESGNLKLHIGRHDLVKMARNIYAAFEYLAQKRRITYTFHAPPQAVYLYFDNRQLEKVFFNLLSNAFKFTHNGGAIAFTINELPDGVGVSISDNGRGIPYESQARLFTSFYQVQDNETENVGSGIGLALSKSIVEQHGGTMTVKSRPEAPDVPGETRFIMHLKHGFAHYMPDAIEFFDGQHQHEPTFIAVTDAEYEPDPAINITDKKEQTLLLVEDNAEVRRFLNQSLSAQYKLLEAANGQAGLELAFQHMPDIVISDVMMPVLTGLEFCRQLKMDDRTSHIPVILLTARAAYLHQVDGLETGADLYLTKPFHMRTLELSIRNLLNARGQMRKKFSQQVTLQPHDVVIESADEKFLEKLMNIIEANMHQPEFGVEALSSTIGMSQSVLYRKIKAVTDLTVADFVKSIRLKKAAILLSKNQLTIADVAYMVGFNNRKHFSREFKKQFGKNPTAYIGTLPPEGVT